MEYYFSTIVKDGFENTITKTVEALKTEGFGVIADIDIQGKMKEKLGVDFKKYRILGACNPPAAYKALLAEEKIGTMLPCNVLVIDKENGTTEVAAINPVASMMAIENPNLPPLAQEITDKLKKVISIIN